MYFGCGVIDEELKNKSVKLTSPDDNSVLFKDSDSHNDHLKAFFKYAIPMGELLEQEPNVKGLSKPEITIIMKKWLSVASSKHNSLMQNESLLAAIYYYREIFELVEEMAKLETEVIRDFLFPDVDNPPELDMFLFINNESYKKFVNVKHLSATKTVSDDIKIAIETAKTESVEITMGPFSASVNKSKKMSKTEKILLIAADIAWIALTFFCCYRAYDRNNGVFNAGFFCAYYYSPFYLVYTLVKPKS